MVSEKFYDHAEHFFGWRCICCGDIIDRRWWRTGAFLSLTVVARLDALEAGRAGSVIEGYPGHSCLLRWEG